MDLSKLDTKPLAEKGTDLTLLHPGTGEPLDIVITLMGSDSKAYRAVQHEIQNQNIKATKPKADFSKDRESGVIKRLAAVTGSWVNMENNGEPIECTPDNAEMVYSDFRWMADQVVAHVENRANFLPSA